MTIDQMSGNGTAEQLTATNVTPSAGHRSECVRGRSYHSEQQMQASVALVSRIHVAKSGLNLGGLGLYMLTNGTTILSLTRFYFKIHTVRTNEMI